MHSESLWKTNRREMKMIWTEREGTKLKIKLKEDVSGEQDSSQITWLKAMFGHRLSIVFGCSEAIHTKDTLEDTVKWEMCVHIRCINVRDVYTFKMAMQKDTRTKVFYEDVRSGWLDALQDLKRALST